MLNRIIWSLLSLFLNRRHSIEDRNIRNILVMRYGFLGDVLQTTPALSALRRAWPKARIDYWVSDASSAALENNPCVDNILSADLYGGQGPDGLIRIFRQSLALRKGNYDLAVCLGSDPGYGILAWLSGIRTRIGLIPQSSKAVFLDIFLVVPLADKMSRQGRYLELVRMLGVEVSDRESIRAYWNKQDGMKADSLLGRRDDLVAFFFGSGPLRFRPWAERKWPVERWIRLAEMICSRHEDAKIVLLGSKSEEKAAAMIETSVPEGRVINLSGKTSFVQMAPILERCGILVSNDSAPVFVAAAVGCPVVVIYGPEWPERARPCGTTQWYPVSVDIPCRDYCASFPAKAPECKNECMSKITVEMVFQETEFVLNNRSRSGKCEVQKFAGKKVRFGS